MHTHGDATTRFWTGVYTEHEHEGGDERPHTHPEEGNLYVNPPPVWLTSPPDDAEG